MNLKDKLNSLVRVKIEVSDLDDLNTEWYDDIHQWKYYIWSLVNRRQPYKVRENIYALKASILDLDDVSLKRFRNAGSRPTYHFISLERLNGFLKKGSYTHVFIEGIGELDEARVTELKEWISEKLN